MKWKGIKINNAEENDTNGQARSRRMRRIYAFGVIALFLFLFYIRFSWFELHYTHHDDIKVAQFTDATANLFRWKYFSLTEKGLYFTKFYNLLLIFGQKIYNWAGYALNFSKYWTYAPGQFFFTFAMLPLAYDYTSIKFFGRLPSLIFGCLALIICWKVIRKYSGTRTAAVGGTLILGLSWQTIIYCMHMSNYEVIILIGFLSALCLYPAVQGKAKAKDWIVCSLALGAMAWFHYQAICCFAGVMLVFLIKRILEQEPVKAIAAKTLALCAIFALVVLPLLFFANMDGKPTWNAGPNGEYLFENVKGIVGALRFFLLNSAKTFWAMLSPVPLDRKLSIAVTLFYAFLFFYGTVGSLKEYKVQSNLFYLTVFSLGVIIAEYGMVVLGKSTLSPTRHSNVLIPAFILQIAQGVVHVLRKVGKKQVRILILGFGSLCITLSFISYYHSVKTTRLDQYTQSAVWSVFSQYEPNVVVDFNAGQMWYLTPYEYERREIIDYRMDFYDQDYDADNNDKVLIISGDKEIQDEVRSEIAGLLLEKQYIDEDRFQKMLAVEPIYEYSNQYNIDMDFYNVFDKPGNNLTYAIYVLSNGEDGDGNEA